MLVQKVMNSVINTMTDHYMQRMLQDPYTENVFSLITTMQKLTTRAVIEAGMRAESGKPIQRPLGSPIDRTIRMAKNIAQSRSHVSLADAGRSANSNGRHDRPPRSQTAAVGNTDIDQRDVVRWSVGAKSKDRSRPRRFDGGHGYEFRGSAAH